MRSADAPSWQIREDRWGQCFDWALWFRATERIDVPAGGVVPGPLDIRPLPDPSTNAQGAAELAAGWLAWWQTLVEAPPSPPRDRSRSPAQAAFTPPEFPGLATWPLLHQVVTRRWREAHAWHNARQWSGLEAGAHHDMQTNQVVAELEQELGRKARPFFVDLILLPVHDDQIRAVGSTRYLVSERLHDGPSWPELLRTLLAPLA